jgi:CRP-like cAMP-binding protein
VIFHWERQTTWYKFGASTIDDQETHMKDIKWQARDSFEIKGPRKHLHFEKGDLIIKEGDYGISIYKIIEGEVLIFTKSEGMEIPLATFGRGEVIGEMVFLKGSTKRRSASARAITDVALEVWHPDMLAKEYEKMPPILKIMADQALKRLVRMNRLVVRMSDKRKIKKIVHEQKESRIAQRRYFRKEIDMAFEGRPVDSGPESKLYGKIRDISLGGVGVQVGHSDLSGFPVKSGDRFHINTNLPNGKKLDFIGSVVSIRKDTDESTVCVGMSFDDLRHQASKDLGFFLLTG